MLCRVLCVLLFVAWTAERPLEFDTIVYTGLWRSPFQVFGPLFVSLPLINLFAWQVLLIAVAPLCLLFPGAFRKRAWAMDAAVLVSVASVVVTVTWGWMRGGSLYQSYYQLWRFLAALLVGALLVSVIRTPRDLKAVGLTVVSAALVRGTLCIYFYWFHVRGKIDPPPPYMTTHDDSLLWVAAIIATVSWALARGRPRGWVAAGLVSALLAYAIVLNNRRLAWIQLILAFALMYVLLPRGRWRRWATVGVPLLAPVVIAYLAIGWNRPGAIFAPVRALSTAGSYSDASSLAREEEVRNLIYTLTNSGNPLLGTGWGMPYEKVTSYYANFGAEWSQYLYLPHNSLVAVAVFGGLVGIFGIWVVVPVAAYLATRGYRGAPGPVERAGAMAAVCVLPAYSAQCYGDIGLQSLQCGLVLSVAIGVASKVAAWAGLRTTSGRNGGRG